MNMNQLIEGSDETRIVYRVETFKDAEFILSFVGIDEYEILQFDSNTDSYLYAKPQPNIDIIVYFKEIKGD